MGLVIEENKFQDKADVIGVRSINNIKLNADDMYTNIFMYIAVTC